MLSDMNTPSRETLLSPAQPRFDVCAACRASMASALPGVESFLQGTIVYVLSQQWYDLLSTYLFRLHPVPYCANPATRPCRPEAAWGVQAAWAAGLLVTMAVVERVGATLAARWPTLGSTFRLRVFMPLAGMCIGWAFGAATVQLSAHPDADCGFLIADCSDFRCS